MSVGKTFSIYCITNSINGKKYIGQTVMSLQKRFGCHRSSAQYTGSGCALHNAIRKYGICHFSIRLLEECASRADADEREKYLIADLKTLAPHGYNIESGGCDNRFPMSKSTKRKLSRKAKERMAVPANRDRIAAAQRQRFSDPTNRQVISDQQKAYYAAHPEKKEAIRRLAKKRGWGERFRGLPKDGENSGRAVVGIEDVKEIRRLYWSNPGVVPGKRGQGCGKQFPITQYTLADMYGVKQVTISKILCGETWPDVIPDEYVGKITWEPRMIVPRGRYAAKQGQ